MAKAAYWTITDAEARKRGGANRIRYRGSPCLKLCILGVVGLNPDSTVANALSIPPGEYARKGETQKN